MAQRKQLLGARDAADCLRWLGRSKLQHMGAFHMFCLRPHPFQPEGYILLRLATVYYLISIPVASSPLLTSNIIDIHGFSSSRCRPLFMGLSLPRFSVAGWLTVFFSGPTISCQPKPIFTCSLAPNLPLPGWHLTSRMEALAHACSAPTLIFYDRIAGGANSIFYIRAMAWLRVKYCIYLFNKLCKSKGILPIPHLLPLHTPSRIPRSQTATVVTPSPSYQFR